MRGLLANTWAELISRKLLWLFGAVLVCVLFGVYITDNLTIQVSYDSYGESGIEQLFGSADKRIAQFFSVTLSMLVFLAVMANAGMIPRISVKGRIEFYLSKPISREALTIGRLLAAWIIYALVILVCFGLAYAYGAYLHGFFDLSIILLYAIYMAELLIWLAIVLLAGTLFRSTVIVVMAAFLIWLAQVLLWQVIEYAEFVSGSFLEYAVRGLYYFLPKFDQIGEMGVALASGGEIESWMPLWSSALFGLVALWAGITFFKRRDF